MHTSTVMPPRVKVPLCLESMSFASRMTILAAYVFHHPLALYTACSHTVTATARLTPTRLPWPAPVTRSNHATVMELPKSPPSS
jgi:hypothetical protein